MPTRSFYLQHAALGAFMLLFGYGALSLADGTYQHQDRVAQEAFASVRGNAGRASLTVAEAR